MTDAERLALAKRLYATELGNIDKYKARLAAAWTDGDPIAEANMVDITRAKLSTMRALFPELMEATQ